MVSFEDLSSAVNVGGRALRGRRVPRAVVLTRERLVEQFVLLRPVAVVMALMCWTMCGDE